MPDSPDPSRMKSDLARLVAIDTQNPPGREEEAAAFVGSLLREAGLDVSFDAYAPGRTNVMGTLANGQGQVFAFNTHLDVVPFGEGWTRDPLRLAEDQGRLFGRGACDAKGPLIAMVEAIRLLAARRSEWSGTLIGIFVADEEAASRGAKHYAEGRPTIDYAVIGEPTSNGTVIAHKGSLRPIVRVHGVTAHSGTPDLGENAAYAAARLVGLIEEHHRTVVRTRRHPLVGEASLTVTRINAGLADNVVPDRCDIMLDRRTVPGEDEAEVRDEIVALLAEGMRRYGVKAEIVDYVPTTGAATETAPDHPIVAASLAAGRRYGAKAAGPQGFGGGCDLVHFGSIGARGTVIGPGSLGVAHKPDEYVPVDEFVAAAGIYRDVALAMLASAGHAPSREGPR